MDIDWNDYVHALTMMPAHSAKALQACWDILEALTPEPRIRRHMGECEGVTGDEDDWELFRPCKFAGEVDLLIFDDTREALWHCPEGHENSVRYATFE